MLRATPSILYRYLPGCPIVSSLVSSDISQTLDLRVIHLPTKQNNMTPDMMRTESQKCPELN